MASPEIDILYLLVGLLVVGGFGLFSMRAKAVNFSGLIAGLVVGLFIWVFGGWPWFIIILTFHLVAAQFTHFKYEYKRKLGVAEGKKGARAWGNVFANGGIPAIFALFEKVYPTYFGQSADIFFAAFIAAIATTTADTLATEIGLLYPRDPRLITSLRKKVPAGTSGGVSPLGEIAVVGGGLLIGGVAWLLAITTNLVPSEGILGFGPNLLMICVVSAFVGSTIDSILGASIQSTYTCTECHKLTEHSTHCGEPAQLVKGWRVLGNNWVNFISSLCGAGIGLLMFYFSIQFPIVYMH
ncbi:MAG: DUF92 domain-containing protein [Promethearchaeati archaeon SRVP18_Atabeyarchaeia-1]